MTWLNAAACICGILLLIICIITKSEGERFKIPGEEMDPSSTKLVYPKRLLRNGDTRECVSTKENEDHTSEVSFVIPSHSGEHIVDLHQNKELVPRSFMIRSFEKDGTPVMKTLRPENCHYHGKIRGNEESIAVISTCTGLRGYIDDGKQRLYVEPATSESDRAHKIYRTKPRSKEDKVYCSTSHPKNLKAIGKKSWDYDHSGNRSTQRVRRGIDEFYRPYFTTAETRYTELMIAVDKNLYNYFGNEEEEVTNRMITLVNAVDKIYSKINIRVVLVALEFWNNGDKIDRNETASVYYDRFAKYRKNTLKKTFPDHDNAQLMCNNSWTDAAGMAALYGMCTDDSSGIVAWDHYISVGPWIASAHEMGNNFGMEHDEGQ